jgi:hypothetical protein
MHDRTKGGWCKMQIQKGISEKGQQCLKKAFKVVPYNDKQVTLCEVKSCQQNILSKHLKTC